ncbi:hypothetical protein ACIHFD_32875 [Nonomuraea sp. NPDC051941]|uniref:hypothetical protein n=1 Tax=Nonomuraea sp. NPDC051941 TaxID=3364373 RepID=UPI0037C5446F
MLVPDLDNDLWHVLNELEELLLTYAVWENTGQVEPGELPAPLANGAALEALRRLQTALAPTQGERAIKRPAPPAACSPRTAATSSRHCAWSTSTRPTFRSWPPRPGCSATRPRTSSCAMAWRPAA